MQKAFGFLPKRNMAATITKVALVDRGRVVGNSLAPTGWTDSVTCPVGATTCIIKDFQITEDCAIDPYCQNTSGKPTNITNIAVTTGQAVLSFDALGEATSIKLNIIDTTTDVNSVWSSSVSKAVGTTTATITDENITTSSTVKVYSSTTSGTPVSCKTVVISTGQVVVTFDALTEAASFRARIFNLS